MQVVTNDKIVNAQIYEVLIRLDENVYSKIPEDVIEFYKNNKDDEYKFFYDENKTLEEQELSRKAVVALAALYVKYCCSEENQKEFLQMFKENEKNYKNELEEQYDLEKILESQNKNEIEENVELRQYENKSFIKKIIDKIKSLFKSKK